MGAPHFGAVSKSRHHDRDSWGGANELGRWPILAGRVKHISAGCTLIDDAAVSLGADAAIRRVVDAEWECRSEAASRIWNVDRILATARSNSVWTISGGRNRTGSRGATCRRSHGNFSARSIRIVRRCCANSTISTTQSISSRAQRISSSQIIGEGIRLLNTRRRPQISSTEMESWQNAQADSLLSGLVREVFRWNA
jgi:hypothetical protein